MTATRYSSFMVDYSVPKCQVVNAYPNMNIDRGHMVPAEDMRWQASEEKNAFYMTNIAPQYSFYNRGIWKKLEMNVRTWTVTKDSCVIYSGCYKCDSIKNGKVIIPAYFYKVIYSLKTKEAIGVLIKHEASDKLISNFSMSVNVLENKIGVKFPVPDNIKKNYDKKVWFK